MITQKSLQELLEYDRDTGAFRWRLRAETDRHVKRWNKKHAGKLAGTIRRISPTHKTDYLSISIGGKRYLGHRLAWLYVTGTWPKAEIDHRDLDGANNAFLNLREATRGQNGANRRKPAGGNPYKGVQQNPKGGRWIARHGTEHIGVFDTPEDAHAAYIAFAAEKYPDFARAA